MALETPETFGVHAWQREMALTRLRVFRTQMLKRVFPAFADIEAEAKDHGEALFKAQLSRPGYHEGDELSLAEHAHEAAVEHFRDLHEVLIISINFATASLFHTHWETPVRDWLVREAPMFGASNAEMKKLETAKLKDVMAFLAKQGWSPGDAAWLEQLEELRLVANTVKHAQGDSAEALFRRNRPLFFPFNLMEEDEEIGAYKPDGANLVIEPEQFATYAGAIEAFWLTVPAANDD